MNPSYSTQRAPPRIKLKCLVLGASGAGKTSIIRRYFYKTFDPLYRVPTVGSDWYTTRVTSPLDDSGMEVEGTANNSSVTISLQVWDTPGRERIEPQRPRDEQQHRQQPSPRAAFLQSADAVMLVYDMTSSTSFKQLLKWYADLSNLLEKRKPVLVVANKLDLLLAGRQQHGSDGSPRNNQGRGTYKRDVLGLGGRFKGNNYRYEYQVSRIDDESHQVTSTKTRNKRTQGVEFSSYLADRENWTTDGSYLHSLITSEDGSHPDTDMVKLWCMRNGLEHAEASAATGQGIDDAFQVLIQLALKGKGEEQRPPADQPPPPIQQWRPNKELDLHQRYAPKEEPCCVPLLQPIRRLLRF